MVIIMDQYTNINPIKKPKISVSAWVWILGVAGLIVSVVYSYFISVYSIETIKNIIIPDNNGESTELGVLDFSNFLYVFDGQYGYNTLDSVYYSFVYSSTRHYSNGAGTYINQFNGNCDFSSSFRGFNYYEIPWIYTPSSSQIKLSFESEITSGNFEARIYALDKNYRVTEDETGMMYVRPEYLTLIYSYQPNSEYFDTITVTDGYYYILVTGAESAYGTYRFSAVAVS